MPAPTAVIELDGAWRLTIDKGPELEVKVPGPWTIQVPGFESSAATVTYRRAFSLTDELSDTQCAVVCFGGVNHSAEVRLNGQFAGRHVGGWTPFEFDVSTLMQPGENLLEVDVGYPAAVASVVELSICEVPHGKQSWYGPSAGIWQSVRLEFRPSQHIAELVIRPGSSSGSLTGRLRAARPFTADTRVTVSIESLTTEESCLRSELAAVEGDREIEFEISVPDPHLWSPANPHLYRLTAAMESTPEGGADSVSTTTGFRDITTVDGEILLNGHPLEIRGVLDQDYHPGSSTIPESDDALRLLFAEVKRLGFNTVRCHIKRPDRRYYELADEMGLLVWAELPSWLTMTDTSAETGLNLMKTLIDIDGHHPSIIIWTIINESWGIDLRDPEQRRWLVDAYRKVKSWTPHTLVVDNSACEPNFHLISDLDDYHVYRAIPEGRQEWDDKLQQFASRPEWTFSPHGDAHRSGDEPLVLSEYGNWGLPYALDQFDEKGQEPWWFATGANWAFGAAEGTGLVRRFEEQTLEGVFGSWEELVSDLQGAQMAANRYQTGSIRTHASVSGYVLTQLSDVQWEANGLFDMKRSPKNGLDSFRWINGEEAVVVRPARYSAELGEALLVDVHIVPPRIGEVSAQRAYTMCLRVDGAVVHSVEISDGNRQSTTLDTGPFTTLGEVEISAELAVNGVMVARDTALIVIISASAPTLYRPVHAADRETARWLAKLDCPLSGDVAESGDVLVTRRFDSKAQGHARAGGRVLVLAEESDALADAFDHLPFASLQRRGGDGDWVPRQDWIRRDGAFASIPGRPLLGIPFESILSEWTIVGIPSPLRPATLHSGLFSGWLRHDAATSVTFPWSRGEVTITTLCLRDAAELDPLRAAVGRAFLTHVSRP